MRNKLFALAVLVATACIAAGATLPPPNLDRTLAAQVALVERQPSAERYNDLGNLLVLAGRAEAARDAYEKALELDAELASAHYNLALLLQQMGENRQSLRHLRAIVDEEPGHARAWFQIGTLHERSGAEDPAVRAFARAYLLDPRLSFADENPQVLDSELTTKALLAAQSELSAADDAPRDYEEPRRIAGLLLPSAPPDSGAPAGPEAPAGEETAAAPPASSVMPVVPGVAANPLAATSESRVVGPQDIRAGSRVGGVTTAPGIQGSVTHLPAGNPNADYGELLRQRLMQQEETRRREEAQGDTARPGFYVPGPRSTGQLEQRLEEQLAARQPPPQPHG